jgi:hypothetical protein
MFLFAHKKLESRYIFMKQSKNYANLLIREGLFVFIFKKIDEIDYKIGNEMLVALRRPRVEWGKCWTGTCMDTVILVP